MEKDTLISTENRVRELFKDKKIRSMFHMSGGNEKELIRIFEEIGRQDWVFSTHRSHYHALLKGMSPDELVSRVIDGQSMHLFSKDLKFFTSSIVGGVLPIAVGVAMGIKRKNLNEKVWVFVGDACSRMGIFEECVHYSTGHKLPIIFVIENNGYCINTNTVEAWGGLITARNSDYVREYSYDRVYPHAGTGDWVDFSKP